MASDNSKALDSLTLEALLESYQERFPGWAVPPVLNPSVKDSPESRPLRQRLVLALASGLPVVEWEQQYSPEVNPAQEF